MRGLPSILSLFRNEFNKFNETGARMLDSIYHMTLKVDKIRFFDVPSFMNVIMDAITQRYEICKSRELRVVYRFYCMTLHHSQT